MLRVNSLVLVSILLSLLTVGRTNQLQAASPNSNPLEAPIYEAPDLSLDQTHVPAPKTKSFSARASAWVSKKIGSPTYLAGQSLFIVGWIVGNAFGYAIDPTLILLNLILSFQAEFAGSLISMAQHVSERDAEEQSRDLLEKAMELKALTAAASDLSGLDGPIPLTAPQIRAALALVGPDEEVMLRHRPLSAHTEVFLAIPPPPRHLRELHPRPGSLAQRFADSLASKMRSWKYVGLLTTSFGTWMLVNSLVAEPFDPFPFIKLNVILTILTTTNTPIIMIDENRKSERSDRRSMELFETLFATVLEQKQSIRKRIRQLTTQPIIVQEQFQELLD